MALEAPEVAYVRNGDVSIAYQVVGAGPPDLVFAPWYSNLAYAWEFAPTRRMYQRLASFSRLILFDKRGTGLSDRPRDLPTLETRMDDLRAVLDAVDSDRAVLLGSSQGGQMCALFAATYPERTEALILFDSQARAVTAPDFRFGISEEDARATIRRVREGWGTRAYVQRRGLATPAGLDDEEFRRQYVTFDQLSLSPAAAHAFFQMFFETDIRDALPSIRVPTLVLGRGRKELARDLAERIPNARLMLLPGDDLRIWFDDAVANEVGAFLAEEQTPHVPDTVLATLLFTDIVGSTERAASLGDSAWRELLERHHSVVRRELARFRGEEKDTAGDGFFATFDGPARAIRCAEAVHDGVRELGLEVRAGVHTGECERHDAKVTGIAVSIGARVAALAAPGEVLVSQTVKDLVAGSGLEFDDRGQHVLKGVPGNWRLFAVTS